MVVLIPVSYTHLDVYKRQPLYGYPVGTWGPLESEAMMHEHGAEWTNPCKMCIRDRLYLECAE